jgi:hypothetical protein
MSFQDFVRVLHLWRIGITLVHSADLYHNGAHLEIFALIDPLRLRLGS